MSSSFRILTLSGFLLVTALGFSSAHAAIFVNKDLGNGLEPKCLTGGSLAFPCTARVDQVYDWESVEIRGVGTTNVALKCLDVRGAGTADGTPVQLFTCNGTRAQRWFYTVSGQILNPPSGKCLDLKKNFTSFPSVVIQTCNTTSLSQQWQIQ